MDGPAPLNQKVVIRSFQAIGAGPIFMRWLEDYLTDCTYYLDHHDTHSECWITDNGTGQGKPMSGDIFSTGCISHALVPTPSDPHFYVDDTLDVVAAKSSSEPHKLVQKTIDIRVAWFCDAGLAINPKKNELLLFGTDIDPVNVNGTLVSASLSMKFLGLKIQQNLKFDENVGDLCSKIRSAAGRIKTEGFDLGIPDRRTLFCGWIV